MKLNKGKIIWDVIGKVLFPENIYCIACGKPVNNENPYSLCSGCRNELLYDQPQACIRCGRYVKKAGPGYCEHCGGREPQFDRGLSAVVYNDAVKRIIYSLKYGGKCYLAKNIAYIMEGAVRTVGEYDIIVPVPMYAPKRRARGYCQATLIARRLGEVTGRAVSEDNLIRNRRTVAMSGMTPGERRDNIRGAFEVRDGDEFRGKRVLLIDDLLTTGSTADECAGVLKKAGAVAVYAAAFASPFDEID